MWVAGEACTQDTKHTAASTHQSSSSGSAFAPPLADRRLASLAGSSTVAKLPSGIVCMSTRHTFKRHRVCLACNKHGS
jgi:ribosomal protein L32